MSGCLGWESTGWEPEGVTKDHEKAWCDNEYKKINHRSGPKEGYKAEKAEGHWPTREKCEQRLRGKMSIGGGGVGVETRGQAHWLADLEQDCVGP